MGRIALKEKGIYRFSGISGIKQLYNHVINSWRPKDAYCIVSAPLESFKKLESFFIKSVHAKRIKDRVTLKMIINGNAQQYGLVRKTMPFTQVKFLDVETPAEYGVLNDLLFIVNYGKKPYGILIKDASLADTFNEYFKILWHQGRKIDIPPLIKTSLSVKEIVHKYLAKNPLIVTDPYNYDQIKKSGYSIICIQNNNYSNVVRIQNKIKKDNHKIIIGLGGCTALDAARACSKENLPCILIPTILSTVCISVNKSVLNVGGEVKTFNTESPQKIILSVPTIMSTKRTEIIRWAQAGFGDLFSKVGASIDVVYRELEKSKDVLSLEKVRRNIPEVFDAIEYVIEYFNGYNKRDIEALAVFLHEASVSIIIRDTFELSGGAEHNLAYVLEKKYIKPGIKPEHGTIVSVGTLIETKLFGEVTGDKSLYNKMRVIYEKTGLPTTYESLAKLGVNKENLVKGIRDISKLNAFMSMHAKQAIDLLDDIFQNNGAKYEKK
ncbi:MAG: iron-containing alcohol dehydrogenase [Candidatus Magasanikbacteria bacterium]|nr:iron-containing alcohol dehydrogenase [Candidatus Magasanikbacteria bacterium]